MRNEESAMFGYYYVIQIICGSAFLIFIFNNINILRRDYRATG